MKKLKSLISLILAAALVFSLAACDKGTEDENTEIAEATSEESSVIELKDQAGREVKLEKKAEKVISCYYISTYALVALGLEDSVAGLEKKADKRPIYKLAAPGLLEKPQLGSLKEFDVEAAAALEPDLIILPAKLEKYLDALEKLGINVIIVNPESQQELQDMLLLIGKACGKEAAARMLIGYYGEKLGMIKSRTSGLYKNSVYMAGNSSFLTAATGSMYQNDIIVNAGGKNAAAELEGDYWTEVSYETVLKLNPEYIIIPSGAKYTEEDIYNDENLKDVKAVINGNIYTMPSAFEEWDSPVPSGVLGVLWLASVIHGEVYPFEEFTAEVKYFYETFYGFTPDEKFITR